MKRILLFAALATGLLSSCSTAFKSGQTPDDLYYSPGTESQSVAREEKRNRAEEEEYQEYISSADDRYLHMKVANRARWNQIDNYSYWYDSRYDFNSYSYYSSFNAYNSWGYYSPFSPYSNYGLNNYYGINPYFGGLAYAGYGGYGGWGLGYGAGFGNYGWGSPYYTIISYNTPKFGGTTTSTSGLSAYRNKYFNNTNGAYSNYRSVNASGNQGNFGDLVRRVFTGSSSNNSSSSFDRPARSFSTIQSSSVPVTSSSAGGNSGGFKSTGSTSSTGRGGRN